MLAENPQSEAGTEEDLIDRLIGGSADSFLGSVAGNVTDLGLNFGRVG